MTDHHIPTLGWHPIPPPTVADDGPPRPSAVEIRLVALLDALATEALAGGREGGPEGAPR